MKAMKRINLLLFILISLNTLAGDTLSLQKAIQIGLENNYSILIAKNNSEISANNNSLGNSGFLPNASIGATHNKTINSTYQKYYSGTIKDLNNAESSSDNANINLNWTLFDGMAMFVSKKKYQQLQQQSEMQLKMTIENTVAEIIVAYYGIVLNTNKLNILQDAVNFSVQRRDLAKAKYRLGNISEIDLLQAEVDLNTDSTLLLKQLTLVRNAKSELNNLLSRDFAVPFDVPARIDSSGTLLYTEILGNLEKENSQLAIYQQNQQIALLNLKLAQAPLYPKISFNTTYNFSKSQSQAGLVEESRNTGPTYGLTLSYPIFTGLANQRNIRNARIQANTAELQYKQLSEDLKARVYQQFNDYQTNSTLIGFEKQNVDLNRKNVALAFQKYKLGQMSDIDLRQIQLKQLDAENRLLQALYSAKQQETELKRLSGKLTIDN
jgi:outer membrane protein